MFSLAKPVKEHMTLKCTALSSALALFVAAAPAIAQQPKPTKASEVTLIGCVVTQNDYRTTTDGERGGPLNSGLGTGNEFVLVKATPAQPAKPDHAAGTVGTSGTSGDYSLTGKLESELGHQVGRLVEVVGIVDDIKAHTSAKDARNLPRLTITLWHPVGDYCPRP
jgi:hypothetical protein